MKDGVVVFYCKDNMLYPIIQTHEDGETIDYFVHELLKPLKVLDEPQCEVYTEGDAIN